MLTWSGTRLTQKEMEDALQQAGLPLEVQEWTLPIMEQAEQIFEDAHARKQHP